MERVYMDAALLDKLQESISDIDPMIFSDLRERGMLVGNDFEEEAFLRDFVQKHSACTPEITTCYLFQTRACNFACKYCYVSSPDQSTPKMNLEVAKTGIDFFLKQTNGVKSGTKRTLVHYGGEPLINYGVVKISTEYAKEEMRSRGLDLETVVVTNGSLINDEMAHFFHEQDVWISLSIDGPEEIHNKMRTYGNGRGTFSDVIRGLNILRKFDCNVLVTCSVGTHNVNRLPEIVEYFHNDLKIDGVKLNPISCPPELNVEGEAALEEFVDKVIGAFAVARKLGMYEETIMRRVKAFVEKEFYRASCGAVGNQLIVFPDGAVGPCHSLGSASFLTGSVFERKDLRYDSVFGEWNKRLTLNMEECKKCEAIAICGGGCPLSSFIHDGTIWAVDKRTCSLVKRLLAWLIWNLYDLEQGSDQR